MKAIEYTELAREGSIVLLKAKAHKKSHRNGFEVHGANSKWYYQPSELRWAWQGYQTLVDAQRRGVLDQRSAWKPYDSHSYVALPPTILEAPSGNTMIAED